MERTIEHWKIAATFWTNAAADAFSRDLEAEARDCQTKVKEAIATVKAWERDQANKAKEGRSTIGLPLHCGVCDWVMYRSADGFGIACSNTNCKMYQVEFHRPTIELTRRK